MDERSGQLNRGAYILITCYKISTFIQFAIHVTSEEPTSISREKLLSVRARKLISAETEVNEMKDSLSA